jgi:hypothetical protein
MDPEVHKKLKRLSALEKRRLEREIAQIFGYDDDEPSDEQEATPVTPRNGRTCRRPGCDFRGWGRAFSRHYREPGH